MPKVSGTMSAMRRKLIPLLAFIVVVPAAKAGLLSCADGLEFGFETTRSMSVPAPVPDDTDKNASRLIEQRQFDELGAASANTAGGVASYDSVESTFSSPPGIISDDSTAERGLASYLLAESRLLLPVPFLDGVFRPPRA
jgi:hypothetical protein